MDNGKHPGGRPPQGDEPKKHIVSIRISDDEMEKLNKCVKIMHSTKTGVLMYGLDLVSEKLK